MDISESPAMDCISVRESLSLHWAAEEYLHIDEAPDSSDRQGRKLDRLVFSLWRSRGFEIDGIEIKISLSDYQREIQNASKADWWWSHVNRFWIAVPEALVTKIKLNELPPSWGLLGCHEKGCRVVRKAIKHDREEMPWTTVLGLLRAASGSGFSQLQQRYNRGIDEGRARSKKEFQSRNPDDMLTIC